VNEENMAPSKSKLTKQQDGEETMRGEGGERLDMGQNDLDETSRGLN
jgi:hypothetical protein